MPEEVKLVDHLFIKIDDDDVPAEVMDDLIEVSVVTSSHLPDMFRIHLHDEDLKWIDEGPFELGGQVEIAAEPEEGGTSEVLFKGEITSFEPYFGEATQAELIVSGYDHSHRLHRGTHTVAYVQSTDSDVASQIARDAGMQAQVDATTEVYDHIFQHNQTHMEFLAERAGRIGYEFHVDGEVLHFRQASPNGDPFEVEWGKQLRSFRPRLTLVEQVDEVIVKGWDPKNRQVITGQASEGNAEPDIRQGKSGGQLAAEAFDSARRVVVDHRVNSQSEADTLAQAILDEISGAYIEAEGLCYGQPQIKAGGMLRLSSLGQRFSGTYFVTEATHLYRSDSGYTTSFTIHGRRPETLHALLGEHHRDREGLAGPMIAIVTNNKDPEDRGRVKVKFPWLSEDVESDWCRMLGVGGGPETGLYWLPEVNDEVLVAFENGDFGRPVVLGGLWNGQDKPPEAIEEVVKNGKVHKRIWKTRGGHVLKFADESDVGVFLETSGGHKLTLDDDGGEIRAETSGGQVIVLDDNRSTVSLESGGDFTLKSGANLTIEAGAMLELKGQTFNLNANAAGEVKAGATLQVQGSLVKIN
jgi:phage protein D/phage baseplate assembly protein gpV